MKKTYQKPSIEMSDFTAQELILSDSYTIPINPIPNDVTVEDSTNPFNGE